MANVPTLGCSQVEAGNVEGCSYEEGKDIDQTNMKARQTVYQF